MVLEKDYLVVVKENSRELEHQVKQLMRIDYVPIGGVAVSRNNDSETFYQAMYRERRTDSKE